MRLLNYKSLHDTLNHGSGSTYHEHCQSEESWMSAHSQAQSGNSVASGHRVLKTAIRSLVIQVARI